MDTLFTKNTEIRILENRIKSKRKELKLLIEEKKLLEKPLRYKMNLKLNE